jgi:hypothetical protein
MSVAARYGDPAATLGVVNEVLSLQLARRSVRRFGTRPVSDEELGALVAAAQSAPTSSNLQPWSVVAVRDPERKRRLARLAAGQAFIAEAPLFLVWIADLGRARRLASRNGARVGAPDPDERADIKPRLPQGAVLHLERYDADTADAHIDAYDERLTTYNTRFGLPGNWSDRVLARLKGPESMAGRHRLRETLERLGLPSR